jgi:peptidyl-prolyl cis-trans isomerase SurA
LYQEAFQRSQKDIHAAHIFISLKDKQGNPYDREAETKRDAVLKRLNAGEDFRKVAAELSDDPSAMTNKGDLGYITVFTIPYEFENLVYSTPPGKFSLPYKSKAGYHIFKILGERKALGKVKAQQILLAIPPGSDDAAKKSIAARADSLYKKIIAGSDFGKLAVAFSNDYVSAANNGIIPDFGTGQYDPRFEAAVTALAKDGAISKPFLTTHGWHIVKRLSIKPVISNPQDKSYRSELEDRIRQDSRWKVSRDFIADQVRKKPGLQKNDYDKSALWALTDSLLDGKPLKAGNSMNTNSPLFRIGDTILTAQAFIDNARAFRYKNDGTGLRPYEQVMDDFVEQALQDYYRAHLEDFNEEFRNQMAEFRDGNLFFEIMQREIWNKAQADSSALVQLYERNRKDYIWKQSADAVVFFCSDQASAKTVYELVKKTPKDWRKITEIYAEKVVGDSSRYEWSQIPNLDKTVPRAGMITAPQVNTTDNTASFAYIIAVYPQPMQRTFNEAKGLVINDYQIWLEEQWNKELRKKYPVVVDQKVLSSILK